MYVRVIPTRAKSVTEEHMIIVQSRNFNLGSQVECPVCRKITIIPTEGLPPNFVLQDMVEIIKKRQFLSKAATSIAEFHNKVSTVCQRLNEKLHKWHLIAEVINTISAKSLEMTETVESMDTNHCQESLKDIEKMTEIVTNIASNFDNLNETSIMTVLQQNRDNILIKDSNIQLQNEVIDLSNVSLQEERLGASCAENIANQVKQFS